MTVAWFCDIDGVLAPKGRQLGRRYEVLHVGGWQGSVAVDLDVIDAVRLLAESPLVDFRWCSNWEMEAQLLLAPALGFPDRPLALPPRSGGWWKSATVRDYVADTGGPFVWTDDEIDTIEGPAVDDLRARGLVISTSYTVGLTLSDVERIEDYAIEHLSPAPHTVKA